MLRAATTRSFHRAVIFEIRTSVWAYVDPPVYVWPTTPFLFTSQCWLPRSRIQKCTAGILMVVCLYLNLSGVRFCQSDSTLAPTTQRSASWLICSDYRRVLACGVPVICLGDATQVSLFYCAHAKALTRQGMIPQPNSLKLHLDQGMYRQAVPCHHVPL